MSVTVQTYVRGFQVFLSWLEGEDGPKLSCHSPPDPASKPRLVSRPPIGQARNPWPIGVRHAGAAAAGPCGYKKLARPAHGPLPLDRRSNRISPLPRYYSTFIMAKVPYKVGKWNIELFS